MKKIFKLFIYVVVFFTFFIIFLPKESFYYLLEKELQQQQVIISNEDKNEKLFSFDIKNADVFYQGINIGVIEKTDFTTYLFYTKINFDNVSFLDSLSSFAPTPIDNISIEHSILNINKIKIDAKGVFGELSGDLNIFAKELKIQLKASDKMKNSYSKLLKNMKFDNERYLYEYKF